MKTIINEKRELLISAKERGEKESDIAKWLKISVRSVSRIYKLYQETQSIQPKTRPGKKSKLSSIEIDKIQQAIKSQPDITLEELIDSLNLPIKKSRLSVILIGLGLSFKKRRYSPKNN